VVIHEHNRDMRNNILERQCFLFLFGVLPAFACCTSQHRFQEVNNISKNGTKKGVWIEVEGNTSTDQYLIVCHYKNGVQHGEYRSNFLEGPLRSKGKYKNGNPVGKWVGYLEDGTVSWWQIYDNNGELLKMWGLMEDW